MTQALWPSAPTVVLSMLLAALAAPAVHGASPKVITPRLTLHDPQIIDQDDMCIWIHPSDPTLSTIIVSDKTAGKVFVYDLAGATLQMVDLPGSMPGNIDLRYKFDFQGSPTDIVGFNDRLNRKLMFFRVDPGTRMLARIDNDSIRTSPTNYGLSLYVSPVSGKYYAFSSTQNGVIEQFELNDAAGQVGATRVRTWDIGGITEGSVADDENGVVFFGEEDVAIWKVGAEPADDTTGTAVATVSDTSGILDDIEGLTLYYAANGEGYLIASSQGNSSYRIYRRKAPHAFVDSFVVSNASGTDGIDITNVSLGPEFPKGIFVLHNGRGIQKPVEVCAYEDLGLDVDTNYWDPRKVSTPTLVSLGTVHAEPGRVRLTWYGSDLSGQPTNVYRRNSATEWLAVAVRTVDGTGQLSYEDLDVEPGLRYGYRLGMMDGGVELFLGEVWVDVPSAFDLGLQGFRPNPAERDLVVAFSLRDRRPADLAIFDATGRQRWSQRLDAFGPGNHVLNLGRMPALPAGVYLLRITQGAASVSARAVVLR